jgi:class 3 adenylate cyclase
VAAAGPTLARVEGEIVKVEGDSLLVRFDDATAACRGVDALEECLRRLNRGRPENEQLVFSYGIGYGDVLDLEQDLFGLEVNLASKLGEDLAQPGEALLTPAAAASLDPATMRRVVPHRVVTFLERAIPVQRLKLRSRRPIRRVR